MRMPRKSIDMVSRSRRGDEGSDEHRDTYFTTEAPRARRNTEILYKILSPCVSVTSVPPWLIIIHYSDLNLTSTTTLYSLLISHFNKLFRLPCVDLQQQLMHDFH